MIKYKSTKSKFLNKEQETDLFTRYKETKSDKLKNEIVENYAALVFSYAKKMCHTPSQYEDIVQEGFIGLVLAIDKFDLSHNCRFLHYANFWVKAKIYNFIFDNTFLINAPTSPVFIKSFWSFRKYKHLSNEEICKELHLTNDQVGMLRAMVSKTSVMYLDAPMNKHGENESQTNSNRVLDGMSVTTFETDFVNKQEDRFKLNRVNESLDMLRPKEKDILLKYYMEEKTFEEIGQEYNLTRQRVEQIKKMSITKIQRILDVEEHV